MALRRRSSLFEWDAFPQHKFGRTRPILIRTLRYTQTAAFVDGGWQLLGAPLPNSSYGPRIAWVPNLQRVMAQVNSVTYRWADGGWVDLQPGTTLPTPTHALVYDRATQRLMALTASDQWVYLP